MALKVHPQDSISISSSSSSSLSSSLSSFSCSSTSSASSSYITLDREVFTIWMKSLVMNSNGCTVYDSNGVIVYRIDNYDKKCSNKVYLMDLKGNILSTILKKRLRLFGRWEGYSGNESKLNEEKPLFQIRKPFKFLKTNDTHYNVTTSSTTYKIERSNRKFACRIVDQAGIVVAEMKQKKSNSGVVLGEDVLTLEVESNVDHSLILGFIVVHGLISRKL